MFRTTLIISTATLIIGGTAFARSGETVAAVRVETPPTLDGIVNPDEYPSEPASGFIQEKPSLGAPAINDTEVYIVYDDEALYFGIVCYEEDVSSLVANNVSRDAFMQNDDTIDIMIDANNDEDSAYDLMINCKGTMYDGQFSADGTSGGRQWDGVWSAETSVGKDRWSCEIRFPWDNMVYDASATEIGIQLLRFQQNDHEITFWTGDGSNMSRVSTFGTLTGLEGLKTPKRFTFIPYGTVRGMQWRSEYEQGEYADSIRDIEPDGLESEFVGDGGIDFGYNGGKPFQFNATFNPDYAQIEADPEVINLTPGVVYLDEKRPFFTETNTAFDNFYFNFLYTRSMTEILAGAKATGTIGRVNYSVLDVQLEEDDIQFPGDNVSAARLKASISGASYVGGMVVARKDFGAIARGRDLSGYNIVGTIDSVVALPCNFSLKGAVAKSHTDWLSVVEPTTSGNDYAYVIRLNRVVPDFITLVGYQEIYENFQSDISFYEPYDLNTRGGLAHLDKTWHVNKGPIRDLKLFVYYDHRRRIDNNDAIYNSWESYFDFYFTNNLVVGPYINRGYDDRFYDYGLTRFKGDRYGLYLATEAMGWGRASAFMWRGEYYGMKYNDLELDLTVLPISSLEVDTEIEFIDPRYEPTDPEYKTAADRLQIVANVKVTHNILDNLYWRAILQGDNKDDLYLGSFLVGWEYLPGSNAYLAYEERRFDSPVTGDFEFEDRRVFLKASYMLTF
ncbi:MAG: carbohydrate binding family 9 domain-containing protein [bacterium]|nr:carbohydrate binding family 9 domain-containing protein [bacterium]